MDVVLVSVAGDVDENRRFVKKYGLRRLPFVMASDAASFYSILGTPYSILVSGRGTVEAKGITNHIEHLESLLATAELGFANEAADGSASGSPVAHGGNGS
jgi:hypothetical protein